MTDNDSRIETSSTGEGRFGWIERLLRVDEPLLGSRGKVPRIPVIVITALLIGILAGVATSLLPNPITLAGIGVGDIGPPTVGAKLYLNGQSPYQVRLRVDDVTLYPFSTSVALAPLLLLPPALWAPVFSGVVAALLALAILLRGEPWRLLIFLSLPFWSALYSVQWSPVFAAALLLPALLPVAIVKPQLGIPLVLSGRWGRKEFAVATAVVVMSIALLPSWPLQWISQGHLDAYAGRSPALGGLGLLLLSCVLLWRNGRGRLLLAMSVISQRYFYDQLLLFVIPRNVLQMIVLLTTSWAGAFVCHRLGWWVPASGVQEPEVWRVMVATTYLPCLVIVWFDRWRARAIEDSTTEQGENRASINRVV